MKWVAGDKMQPLVVIILVNWNGKSDTLECLASLAKITYDNFSVIVVDNGSRDDSAAAIRREFPKVRVIETGKNLGFTGGNNVGIRSALESGAEYVFLLNNDTVVDPEVIGQLVAAAKSEPSAGILTPVIHYYDAPETYWFAGSTMDLRRAKAVHDNSSPPGAGDAVRELPWASGCAMLIPRDAVDLIGGFDDRFYLNWEDVDLSIRVRNKGRRILMVPRARIWHKVNRSFAGNSPVATYYYVRNHLLIAGTYSGASYRRVVMRLGWRYVRAGIAGFCRRKPKGGAVLRMTVRAIRDHFRKRYGALAP